MTAFPTGIHVGDAIALQREDVRSWLAFIIIGLLAVLAIGLVVYAWAEGGGDTVDQLITGLFAPVIGIAGTVLGFYFGSQDKQP
jgi:hypothetical protein